jgi:hypothetical protein
MPTNDRDRGGDGCETETETDDVTTKRRTKPKTVQHPL